MQKLLITVSVAGLSLAVPAHAGVISLNAPYDAGPTFTPLPGNMFEVSGGLGGTVAGYQPPYQIGPVLAMADFSPVDLTSQNGSCITGCAGSLSFSDQIFAPDLSGTLLAADQMTATITWTLVSVVDDGSYSVGPQLGGTGIVTSSSGDDAFETDFPVGGAFNIGAAFLSQCGRLGPALGGCAPDQILYTNLINGAVDPTGLAAVPSPLIGKPEPLMLLCLALLGLVRRYWNGVNRG